MEKNEQEKNEQEKNEKEISEKENTEKENIEKKNTEKIDPVKKDSSSITPEATFDSPNGKDVHRPVVYLELALAIIALVFIIVAIVDWKKKNVTDPAVSSDTVSETGLADANGSALPTGDGYTLPEIDNSALEELKPAVPDAVAMNTLSTAECDRRVAAGTMIRLECEDGTFVYVSNYRESSYLASHLVITDADVDSFIKEKFLDLEPVNVPADHSVAQLGDTANIDYVGTLDGVAFDGGTAYGYDLSLGSGTFIPGFEDGVVGMAIGDTKDISLTFPADYHAEMLAGKEVIFTVTLNGLSEMGYATELTDDLANYFSEGRYPTAAELKDYIKTGYLPVARMQEFLTDGLYVSDVSSQIIDDYYEMQLDQYVQTAAMYNFSFEEFVSMQGFDLQQVLEETMAEAAAQARLDVLYRAVLENDLAPVSDDDILALAQTYSEDTDAFIAEAGRDNMILYLQRDKATAYLQELADRATAESASVNISEDNMSVNDAANNQPEQNAQ